MSKSNKEILKIKYQYYFIEAIYNLGIVVFAATLYLYLENIGHNLNEISLFISLFWITSLLTEIPSGVLSDSFGRKNTMIISCVVRAIGLLIIAFSHGELTYLIAGATLTALGESLKSGTWDSWFVDNIKRINSEFPIDKVFSTNGVISQTISIFGGFIGAQFFANINLSYPISLGAILLLITAIVVIFFVKEGDSKYKKQKFKISNSFKEFFTTLNLGYKYFKSNHYFSLVCLTFVPLTIILAGPGNQWQLFFQPDQDNIRTGYIWIFIGVSTLFGTWVIGRIPNLNKYRISILLVNIIINTLCISILVFLENFYVAVFLFLIHVFITAGDEILRITFLHNNIPSENRSTLMSFFYTLEALFTIIGLTLVGMISENFSMGLAWLICAITGFIISFPLLLYVKNKKDVA
ncbi:MFS transporter [Virgibacillus salexigens]|uniref:MFS transporter n=1 Tax=Virgibacillus massiliensis TaxID=1462526 RepID=UPI001369A113|nr:MFS transporter [Virgibacillus massiliensis]MYL43606.1 MFS transporter [Virgibacillus massiliensis]